MPFTTEELQLIDGTDQVRIETRTAGGVRRTVIWVVVDDDTVFVRSVRGDSGRWYQRALADPEVTLDVAGQRIAARAVPAADEESIDQATEAFRRKYPPGGSLDSMVRPGVTGTTLRLDPRV